MSHSICIITDYHQVHIALARQGIIDAATHLDKHDANRCLVPALEQLLIAQHYSLADLSYLAVCVGPAPYTSLRIALATANGLARSTAMPLVEIDALAVYNATYHQQTHPVTITLFNAFNQDIFFGISDAHGYRSGWAPVKEFLASCKATYAQQPLIFCGNGALLYAELIDSICGDQARIDAELPAYTPLATLVHAAEQSWKAGNTTRYAQARHLKATQYHNSIKIG